VPGGQPSPGFLPDTIVTAINDSGEAIGILRATPSIDHGFLRDASGNITVFDVPGALEDTDPLGINNAGQIVGAYRDPNGSGQFFGFLRNPDGTFVDFALPSCPFLSPTDINNLGQIVGYCGPGNQFGFLATADDFLPPTGELVGPALPPANIIITPEPSSFVLLMVCISVLAICVKQNLICTIR
jgi:hypothetical protein